MLAGDDIPPGSVTLRVGPLVTREDITVAVCEPAPGDAGPEEVDLVAGRAVGRWYRAGAEALSAIRYCEPSGKVTMTRNGIVFSLISSGLVLR